MATQDKCCTLVPYFKIAPGEMENFKQLCQKLVAKTNDEPKCLYYGFSFNGELAYCREGYADASGVLAHLENIASLLDEILKISDLSRLEIHGVKEELEKLRQPLAHLKPQFFVLEYGFRH